MLPFLTLLMALLRVTLLRGSIPPRVPLILAPISVSKFGFGVWGFGPNVVCGPDFVDHMFSCAL